MEIDDEYSVEDFATEIAAMSPDSEDECEFCGFRRSTHAARNIEESKEGEEEDGPLYRMDALTSEVDALMSSPSKALDYILPSEDDHEDTPIARKVAVKGKGKVMEKGSQGSQGKDLRKTKGALLQEMITTTRDQPNGDGFPCGPVNSKGVVGMCVYSHFGLSPCPNTQSHNFVFLYPLFPKPTP